MYATLHRHRYPLLVIALFLLQFLFISPLGEFALNDDWVHTEILQHWVETGEFRMNPFAGPTFFVPILYGAGLVQLFGFSFSLLRISTLIIALGTLLLTYALAKKISGNERLSFFAALVLWLNPIFYNLSFTFMTDVPALFLLIASLYCFYAGLTHKKYNWIFFGALLSVVGAYTRQTNILVVAAFGLYTLAHWRAWDWKRLSLSLGIPIIIGGGVYLWLSHSGLLPPGVALHFVSTPRETLTHVLWWLYYISIYAGFFAWPLLLVTAAKKNLPKGSWRQWLWTQRRTLLLVGMVVLVALLLRQTLRVQFPYVLNIVNPYGLGPMKNVLNGSLLPVFDSKLWGVFTLLFAGTGGWLLARLSKLNQLDEAQHFLIWFAIIFSLPILLWGNFDRYLLPLFFVGLLLLVYQLRNTKQITLLAVGALVGYGTYSITQTSFYLQWNEIRWELANRVVKDQQLAVNEIDAGYEWNGYHAYWSAVASGLREGPWATPWWIRHVFVNNTQEYIISFSPIAPYQVVETKLIPGLNPNNTLYVLKKPRNPAE